MNKWIKGSEIKPETMPDIKQNEAHFGEWIPVINGGSNPMPEENKVYLVTYETLTGKKYVRDCHCNYSGGTFPRYIGWSKKINGEVIAWMPLPEPYNLYTE